MRLSGGRRREVRKFCRHAGTRYARHDSGAAAVTTVTVVTAVLVPNRRFLTRVASLPC
jgi:hypothetical protein